MLSGPIFQGHSIGNWTRCILVMSFSLSSLSIWPFWHGPYDPSVPWLKIHCYTVSALFLQVLDCTLDFLSPPAQYRMFHQLNESNNGQRRGVGGRGGGRLIKPLDVPFLFTGDYWKIPHLIVPERLHWRAALIRHGLRPVSQWGSECLPQEPHTHTQTRTHSTCLQVCRAGWGTGEIPGVCLQSLGNFLLICREKVPLTSFSYVIIFF